MIRVQVEVEQQPTVAVAALPAPQAEVRAGSSVVVVHDVACPAYTGPTTVVPQAHQQTVLETADKLLLSDITVDKVPFYSTSNAAGGQTVYIACTMEGFDNG